MKLNELTIKEASYKLQNGEITSVELTKACLDQIEKLDQKVEAFLEVYSEEAIESAKESDKRREMGVSNGPLDGIPYALKDVFATPNHVTSAASKILENYQAPYEATTVQRLRKAGAIILGRTNTDEFTMGSSTETSHFQTTKNPWDLSRVPGGSSGGSAAAVAARMALFSIGTDTGGSIRQPAALCGIVGIKPTYGRVSRFGEFPMASSLDQTGPFAQTVEDTSLVLQTIAGHDDYDSTSIATPVPDYTKSINKNITDLRVGIPKEFFGEGVSSKTEELVHAAIEQLREKGAHIVEVSLPNIKYALAVYYVLAPAEVSSNLARYDGIHYGYSATTDKSQDPKNLYEDYSQSRKFGFGDEVKRRVMLGTYVLSAGYYDAYYKKAQKVRSLLKQDFDNAFKEVDCLVTPTSPTPAFKIGEKSENPLEMYKSDILTISINLVGIPGMSIPCGFENNLPVGMQILGNQLGEEILFKVGSLYQAVTEWHLAKPDIIQD